MEIFNRFLKSIIMNTFGTILKNSASFCFYSQHSLFNSHPKYDEFYKGRQPLYKLVYVNVYQNWMTYLSALCWSIMYSIVGCHTLIKLSTICWNQNESLRNIYIELLSYCENRIIMSYIKTYADCDGLK